MGFRRRTSEESETTEKRFRPIKVLDIELEVPLPELVGLERYQAVQGLVRRGGRPLGYVRVPVRNGSCSTLQLGDEIRRLLSAKAASDIATDASASEPQRDSPFQKAASVTVAVCTRDRTENLELCIESCLQLDYPDFEVLIVDNAPKTEATRELITRRFPSVRYITEIRPGLGWARNRAIKEANGEIIAFTDDDAVVDPNWVRALTAIFAKNEQVMAVTGLIVTPELETKAQILFEEYGGFGKGFCARWYQLDRSDHIHIGAGRFGSGANMSFRRTVFSQIGGFDPALGAGTVTKAGEDIEMFFRVLQEGHILVYEPAAIVRHRHCRDYEALKTQLANNGMGFYSYMVRAALAYPNQRWYFVRGAINWLARWSGWRLACSFVYPKRFPRDLILAELFGSLIGLTRYPKAQREARKVAQDYGD
jgi:GT2 family glycosyltransferase